MAQPFDRSRMTRRDLLRLAAVASLGAAPLLSAGGVAAAPARTAAPVTWSVPGRELTSGERAVQEAQKYSGLTLNVTWPALQDQEPRLYAGPLFERLTGVKINIITIPGGDDYAKILAEHTAGTGAYDVINVVPYYLGDFIPAGVVEPLDPYIEKYMNKTDLDDYLPIFKTVGTLNGKYYGLFDDGDQLVLFYRKDIFGDPAHQSAFRSKFGYDLPMPENFDTWQKYADAATYFTEALAPNVYGIGAIGPGGANFAFMCYHRLNGGQFFDPETMEPGINKEPGVLTLQRLVDLTKQMPPGGATWDPVASLSAYLSGQLAMMWWWPAPGRWAEGVGLAKELSFVPKSQVVGKTGYAPLLNGHTEAALGFELCVSADSKNKEAAYLFIQWLVSPEISVQRVMLPYLRDPYRLSHVESPLFRNAWETAGDYLDVLKQGGSGGALLDLYIPGAQSYISDLDKACQDAYSGTDPQTALDECTRRWNDTTDRLGRDKQKAAYNAYLKIPGATLSS